jgi:hypothetical protein
VRPPTTAAVGGAGTDEVGDTGGTAAALGEMVVVVVAIGMAASASLERL